MKEKNKPEPEIVEQPIVVVEKKEKRERKYIALSDVEIIDLIETYRKLLRNEINDEKEVHKNKIIELEREMKLRNKIKSTKQ